MERVGIRELRNYASEVVRRARAGERIVITVDGIPAAQIVPLDAGHAPRTIEDLIGSGRLLPRRSDAPAAVAHPIVVPGPRTSTEVLDEQRRDRTGW